MITIGHLISHEFSRNIGLLTEAEQARLLTSRVAVAGAGGVGGIHLLTLARLGVGRLSSCWTFNANPDFSPQGDVF